MSEKIVTFCDICNTQQSTYGYKGIVEVSEKEAIELFDWIRQEDLKIKCLECQKDKNI